MIKKNESGFSIIELMVSISVGALVMMLVFNSYMHIVRVSGNSRASDIALTQLQIFQYRIGKEIREGRRSNPTTPACIVDTTGFLPGQGGDGITITTFALSDQYDDTVDNFNELIQVNYRYDAARRRIERLVNTCDANTSSIDNHNFNNDGNWVVVFEDIEREGPNLGVFREITIIDSVNTEQLFEVRFRVMDVYGENIMSPSFRYTVRGL